MEKNNSDEKLLSKIETQAQWDEYIGDFVRDYADIFLRRNISLDAGLICWQLNLVKNRICTVQDTLEELIEAVKNGQ